ncbi:MAG: UDP-glucose 4-epimerase GalE [Motiliproteus sp.]
MAILVTGGAGYIGSHSCVQLLEAGYEIVVLDNLSNSSIIALERVEKITAKRVAFVEGDIRDRACLDRLFSNHDIDSVVHFAGLKAVGESCEMPLHYYDNNISGTVILCQAMQEAQVKTLVFSSSATVYGEPQTVPIKEDFPTSATNPYGRSKLMIEEILQDLYASDNSWRIALLRYFNPVGAHASGLIGEDPNGIPNNLLPYIAQVAIGRLEKLSIFGGDYPTEDGTGVRDYIHVLDLADGHLKALEALQKSSGVITCNLGTGQGYSVLEMVKAFEKASAKGVAYHIVDRRPGDIPTCYADPFYAEQTLGWRASRDLDQMMIDSWRWQSRNPHGYDGDS